MTEKSIAHWNATQNRIANAIQIRAAIYIRVSSKNQEKGYSLETQLEGCLLYCKERGYIVDEIRHIYRETMTGVIYRQRPILSAARAAARNQEFDVLVVYDVDRLSRDPVHQLIISDELTEHKVRLESVLREIEDTDEGRLIQFTRGWAAKLEHERLRDRFERGQAARLQNGHLRAGGHPLYGYTWLDDGGKKKSKRAYDTTVVYTDPEGNDWTKADVVSYIFDCLKQEHTFADIAIDLNKRGVPTPEKGKQWRRETIGRIANNIAYAGVSESLKKQYYKDEEGKKRTRVRPEEERVRHADGVTPPLVDLDDWYKIQNNLQRHRQLATRNNQNPTISLLRGGYARCGYCNRALRVHKLYTHIRQDGRKYELWYYECPRGSAKEEKCLGNPQVKIDILDDAVWQYLREKINDPQQVEEFIKHELQQGNYLLQEDASIRSSLSKIEAEQEELLADLKNLAARYKPPIYARLNELAAIQEELEKNLAEVDGQIKSEEEIDNDIKEFKQWCDDFRSSVDQNNAPYERKREACERFNVKVILYERDKETKEPVYEITAEPIIVMRSTKRAASAKICPSIPLKSIHRSNM
jgi:site-specific DNA recombinase